MKKIITSITIALASLFCFAAVAPAQEEDFKYSYLVLRAVADEARVNNQISYNEFLNARHGIAHQLYEGPGLDSLVTLMMAKRIIYQDQFPNTDNRQPELEPFEEKADNQWFSLYHLGVTYTTDVSLDERCLMAVKTMGIFGLQTLYGYDGDGSDVRFYGKYTCGFESLFNNVSSVDGDKYTSGEYVFYAVYKASGSVWKNKTNGTNKYVLGRPSSMSGYKFVKSADVYPCYRFHLQARNHREIDATEPSLLNVCEDGYIERVVIGYDDTRFWYVDSDCKKSGQYGVGKTWKIYIASGFNQIDLSDVNTLGVEQGEIATDNYTIPVDCMFASTEFEQTDYLTVGDYAPDWLQGDSVLATLRNMFYIEYGTATNDPWWDDFYPNEKTWNADVIDSVYGIVYDIFMGEQPYNRANKQAFALLASRLEQYVWLVNGGANAYTTNIQPVKDTFTDNLNRSYNNNLQYYELIKNN